MCSQLHLILMHIFLMFTLYTLTCRLRGTDQAVLQDVECSTDSFLTLLQCSHKSFLDREFDRGKCNRVVYVTCCEFLHVWLAVDLHHSYFYDVVKLMDG